MQFVKTVQLQGDSDKYSISPDIKRYTLIDLGLKKPNAETLNMLEALILTTHLTRLLNSGS